MADTLAQSELEQVLERVVRNNLEIKRLQDENDTLKSFFKDATAFPAGAHGQVGKFYYRITANTRLDEAKVKKEYPPSKYSYMYKTAVDSAAVKRNVPTKTYAELSKVFDNRVEIGLN